MIEMYNPDVFVKKFGTMEIDAKKYEHLKKTDTFPYVLSKKWTSKLIANGDSFQLMTFATSMTVAERLIDTDTGVVKLKLKHYNGMKEVETVFDSSVLTAFGSKELFRYGIRFGEEQTDEVIKYLLLSEAKAPPCRTYAKLGWTVEDGVEIFKTSSAVSKDGVIPDLTYSGNCDLKPKGSLDVWRETVINEVLLSLPLTVVMLLGFASAVLAYLNRRYDLGTIMFNLSNRSSKGKTTAAMLAASVFSNPVMNKGSVISFHATENALVQCLSDFEGHTVVIDEGGIRNTESSSLFYAICNGRSKMRLNGDATHKEVKTFSSIVLTTAEFELIHEDDPAGIKARVFEIKDTLTTSAQNSDNIKKCIVENHGVAGEKFIHYLVKRSSEIYNDYEQDKQLLSDRCKEKRELTERLCSKLAVILTTARYVNEALELKIDVEKIIEYLVGLESQVSDQTNSEERLIEIIRQEVVKNQAHFKIKTSDSPAQCWGAVKCRGDQSEIQITETAFQNFIKSYQLTGWRSTLKKLKAQGVLRSERDRLYKRVVLLEEVGRQKCYCFKIDNHRKLPRHRDILEEVEDLQESASIMDEFSSGIIEMED